MHYSSLWDFVTDLEKAGELVRIKEFINPELEITEIADRVSKQPDGGKALLFENNGTEFPLLINALGSETRICKALRQKNLNSFNLEILSLFDNLNSLENGFFHKLKLLAKLGRFASCLPRKKTSKGRCQEVINLNPDLLKFPILKCWPFDGGPFITLPVVHTVSPINGIRNIGMYRMQVFSSNTTGMHWHRHKGGAQHYREYKSLNKKMPVVVTLGGDPVYTYVATAPLPDNLDEYIFAGILRKKRVQLVKCITQDLYVPEDVDIVIEGYVDPGEELVNEGPFGDHTGFYSLTDKYPLFHVTCVTCKKKAVYPATIVGIPPQEDYWIARATERHFLPLLKLIIAPDIIDFSLPKEGVAHNLMIVKIRKKYPGHPQKVMHTLWGAGQMMFNKILVVVDESVEIHNNPGLINEVFKNINPFYDIILSKGPLDVLDHAADINSYGGKIGIDATKKTGEEIIIRKKPFNYTNNISNLIDPLLDKVNEIQFINLEILRKGLPVLILGLADGHIPKINKLITEVDYFLNNSNLYIFLVDEELENFDLNTILWYSMANFDPMRDFYQLKVKNKTYFIFDGKNKFQNFSANKKHWPNVITSNADTIKKIDEIWEKLGLGKLILSPSLKYNRLKRKGGAFIEP